MIWKPHAIVIGICAALVVSQSDQTTTWWWWTETSTTPPSTSYVQPTTQPSSPASTPYPHYIDSCWSISQNAYLDIVFLFDSTSKARFDGFLQQVAFISDYVSTEITVGQDSRQTRVAFINVGDDITVLANLSTISSASQATSILQSSQFKNASNYNLDQALTAAGDLLQNGRQNIKKAVIVLSTHSFICDARKKSLPKDDPCSQVSKFISNDWAIITVGLRITTSLGYPKISLGWPCYEFQDDYTYWAGRISSALTNINCYCPPGFTQFGYSYDSCYKTSECVRLEMLGATYASAQFVCRAQGYTLSTIYAQEKDLFLKNIALNSGTSGNQFLPFYLGLRRAAYTSPFVWDNGEQLQNNDYSNWYENNSVIATPSYDQCATLTMINGFQTAWWVNSCTEKLPFFCQVRACDTYRNICA